MTDASQRMLRKNSHGELRGMSPPIKKHLELQIKTLQNAARDADKLKTLEIKTKGVREIKVCARHRETISPIILSS